MIQRAPTRLSHDAETVLIHLGGQTTKVGRQRPRILEKCQMTGDPSRADRALAELQTYGFVCKNSDGTYELSGEGMAEYRRLKNVAPHQYQTIIKEIQAGANVSVGTDHTPQPRPMKHESDHPTLVNMQRVTPAPDDTALIKNIDSLPSIEAHPLYHHVPVNIADEDGVRPNKFPHQIFFYMAFHDNRDKLPIPIVDGMVVGRGSGATIRIENTIDPYVSNQHVRFEVKQVRESYQLYIEDLASKNGTLVDGRRIAPRTPTLVKHGSVVQIGCTNFSITQIPYKY